MTAPTDVAPVSGSGGVAAAAEAAAAGGSAHTLLEHASALQSVLSDLSTVTISHLVAFFEQNQHRTDFPSLIKQAVPLIVMPQAKAASQVTAQWYGELDPAAGFKATPVVNLPTERMDKTVDWALYAPARKTPTLFVPSEDVPDDDHTVDPDVTLSRLAGSTKRMVYDAGRDTVVANAAQQGVRYARYAQPDACAFCRLLATRTQANQLYHPHGVKLDPETGQLITVVAGRTKSLTLSQRRQRAAGATIGDPGTTGQLRGTQALGEKYHDHCRCIAVPVPAGENFEAPDYVSDWKDEYAAAVDAARAEGKTKGEYGAVDVSAVLTQMRKIGGDGPDHKHDDEAGSASKSSSVPEPARAAPKSKSGDRQPPAEPPGDGRKVGGAAEEPNPRGDDGGKPPEPPTVSAAPAEDPAERLDRLFADQTNSATDGEKQSVTRWQGKDRFYEQVQGAATGDAGASDEAMRVFNDLRNVASALPEDTSVFRAVRDVEKVFGVPADQLASLEGTDHGIDRLFATSAHEDVVRREFATPAKSPAVMRITAKAGADAVWVPPLGDPDISYQGELLFTRGLQLSILSVDTTGDVPVIEAELRGRGQLQR